MTSREPSPKTPSPPSDVELDNLPVPKEPEDITVDWLGRVTKINNIRPDSLTVTSNVQAGVGFLSNMCRVFVISENEDGQQKEHHILVKLLPTDPKYRNLTLALSCDKREINFFKVVRSMISYTLPEITKHFYRHYYGNSMGVTPTECASALIIEDLTPRGYKMMDPESPNWENNLENVIDFLAKFHAASIMLEEKENRPLSHILEFCMGAADWKGEPLMSLAGDTVPKFKAFLNENAHRNRISPEVSKAYGVIADVDIISGIFDKCLEELSKGTWTTLLHGDIWPQNIMFVDDETIDTPMKVVDWQLFTYLDPVVEMTVALLNCLSQKSLTRAYMDHYAKVYWDIFQTTAQDTDFIKRSKRPWPKFKETFDNWGMVYAWLWFLLRFKSFPDPQGQERLLKVFVLLQEEYKIHKFLDANLIFFKLP